MTYAPDTAEDSGESAVQNALLPRSMFSDQVKPGDSITLKVSAIFGDEVEVELSDASEPEETNEPPMMSADEEIEEAAEQV